MVDASISCLSCTPVCSISPGVAVPDRPDDTTQANATAKQGVLLLALSGQHALS